MQFDTAFLLSGVVPVKKGVAAGLYLVTVSCLFRIWSAGTGFVINDFALLHEVEDADQPR